MFQKSKARRKQVGLRAKSAVPFVGVDLSGHMGGKHIRRPRRRGNEMATRFAHYLGVGLQPLHYLYVAILAAAAWLSPDKNPKINDL